MGLLDDAIREHLELKRLRGADPGEVAREQQEVLNPALHDEHAERDHDPAAAGPLASEATPVDVAPTGDHPVKATQPTHKPEPSTVGQETDELDMRTVMDEDDGAPADDVLPAGPVATGPVGGAPLEEHPEENSLEWEVPGESSRQPAPDPGHHGHVLSEDHPIMTAGEGDAAERTDDVLEETPDFLRDTPEQERLRFEPPPPRDFDFDK